MALQSTTRGNISTMSLYNTWTVFTTELHDLESEIRSFTAASAASAASTSHAFSLEDEFYLEGHLSRLWQAWGKFCRSLIIESCLGAIDGNGNNISAIAPGINEQKVSAAAIRACQTPPRAVTWAHSNGTLRKEPTWGDAKVITQITSTLNPNNASQINAAISNVFTIARDLQAIRNAAAHTNSQTQHEVDLIRTRYITFPTTHPIQSTLWTVASSSDFLIAHAIDELRSASLFAIS